jgi:alkanesulfonate monooxygenase SsuD/methylene tetrahydromethanopterin reductase-like flavin-dependent oxidoreductase (luciferase family)
VGPAPATGERPGLLVGGSTDVAFQRAARHADGWTMGGGTLDRFSQALDKLNAAWTAAGRQDKPRTAALL